VWDGIAEELLHNLKNASPVTPQWDEALAINSVAPQLVVGTTMIQVGDSGPFEHAFRWTVGDPFVVDLTPDLLGTSAARAVNGSGVIVGNFGSVAARWHGDGIRLLENPLPFPISQANDINSTNIIVGEARISTGPSEVSVAFVVHGFSDGVLVIVDLNTEIDSAARWELRSAAAVNNKGQIVGWGLHEGMHRAFRLTPETIDIPEIPVEPPRILIDPPFDGDL
jgi:hypothetical protein